MAIIKSLENGINSALPENYKEALNEAIREIKYRYDNSDEVVKADIELEIYRNISNCSLLETKIYLSSFMLYISTNDMWLDELITSLLTVSGNQNNWKVAYQIWQQLGSIMFTEPKYQTNHRKKMMAKIYRNIVDGMKRIFNLKLEMIPYEERNHDLVIFMTCQYLSIVHGPTKTILDRCSTVVRKLGKKVMIINSAELLNVTDNLPLYFMSYGSYADSLLNENEVCYEGIKIPFFQCEHNMPCVEGIIEVMDAIDRLRPEYIVLIGGDSLLCEMCSEIVPAISIGTVPSSVGNFCGQLQVVGKKISEDDLPIIEALGKDVNSIIEGRFTSSVPMKKTSVTRNELGLPEDDFLCIVVGARLNQEITDEFVQMMNNVNSEKVKFVFAGSFDEGYKHFSEKYEWFKQKASYIGFSDNMMGVYEQCQLYINPLRRGGGTSVIEAMYEGLPSVAFNYGDVALGCGADFFVQDYDDMARVIDKYATDNTFYEEQSQKARVRADEMLDTDKAFCMILDEANKRLNINTVY